MLYPKSTAYNMGRLTLKFMFNRKNRLNKDGKGLIQLRLTFDRSPRYFSTGIYVEPKYWDDKRGRVKNHGQAIRWNAQFSALEQQVADYYEKNRRDFSVAALMAFLQGDTEPKDLVLEYFSIIFEDQKLAPSTLKQHKIFLSYLQKYNENLTFQDIDYDFKRKFESWLLSQPSLRGGTISQNYVGLMLRILKRYLTEALKAGRLAVNPFMGERIKTTETKRAYLSGAELARIEALDVSDRRGYIAESRDLFLFSCYTGLRFSDVCELTDQHLIPDEEGLRLKKVLKKTKKQQIEVDLPLYILFEGRPERLIKKYLEKERVYSELFGPHDINFTKTYNDHLKLFAEMAGIDKNMSSHVGRNSCAMILLNEYGYPFEVVQKVLGHASIVTTQQHYAKLLSKSLDERLKKLM